MTILTVYFSYMLTVKHLLSLMNYRRNRINFVFFELLVEIILRGQFVRTLRFTNFAIKANYAMRNITGSSYLFSSSPNCIAARV